MSFVSLLRKPKIVTLTSSQCAAPSYDCIPPERSVPLSHLSAFSQMGGKPAAYLSWLICKDYDAFDVCHSLTDSGYEGTSIFISPDLPDTAMVLHELAASFPKINVTIWRDAEAPFLAESFCAALLQARPVTRPS